MSVAAPASRGGTEGRRVQGRDTTACCTPLLSQRPERDSNVTHSEPRPSMVTVRMRSSRPALARGVVIGTVGGYVQARPSCRPRPGPARRINQWALRKASGLFQVALRFTGDSGGGAQTQDCWKGQDSDTPDARRHRLLGQCTLHPAMVTPDGRAPARFHPMTRTSPVDDDFSGFAGFPSIVPEMVSSQGSRGVMITHLNGKEGRRGLSPRGDSPLRQIQWLRLRIVHKPISPRRATTS